ncbi:MAG TPA: hypothetical protein VEB66_07805 [Opitutaceae bacterium]|nr:hypothetical protein [Opitutaceae bacterium]
MHLSPSLLFRRAVVTAALLALPAAFAGTERSAVQWLDSYYVNPQPDRFVPAMFELSRSGWFEADGRVPLAIGFVASVFQQNPERVDDWLHHCQALPPAHQRLIVSALWYSGHPKGAAYLAAYARTTGGEVRAGLARTLADTPDLHGAAVRSPSSAQLQWGVFLATGEAGPVRAILAALGSEGRIGSELRWSFAQQAARHDRAVAICRAELARQPNEVRETLRAVIHRAEQRSDPGSS